MKANPMIGPVSVLLKTAMWVLFAGWIGLWFLRPTKLWSEPWKTLLTKTSTSYFGSAGSVNLLFSAPIFLIAILGSIYLHISRYQLKIKPKSKKQRVSLWAYPVFVQGPLGTVTAGEFLILLIFVGLLAWTISLYIINGLDGPSHMKIPPGVKLWQRKWGIAAARIGAVGALCLAFLFFPITRGSVLLQLLNISFENSVKYHIWIANMTMALFTAHGMSYVLLWGLRNQLQEKLSSWQKIGSPHLSGEIALLAGLTMWLTSLKPIRQHFFEVFYYTHQLYLIFIIFFALHVGDTVFSLALPGIFLFLLDRYLRLLQSQRKVHIISARKLPSKILHLVIAKHPGLEYKALSVVLLKIPFLSHLEWHPFSIISTSRIDSDQFSILIKCQKSWTEKLENFMGHLNSTKSPLHLEVAIEGPYGPSSSYFLRYDTLILIGGGSGIAPLLSILSEVLHQHSSRNEDHIPSEVILIWSVKQTEQLCILNLISPSTICPNYSEVLKLEVQAYVTRVEAPDSEMGKLEMEMASHNGTDLFQNREKTVNSQEANGVVGCVHSVSSINNTLWQGAIIAVSILGYLTLMGLLNHFYIYPKDHNSYEEYPWWARGLITIICMTVGIVIFGGLIFMAWNRKNTNKLGAKFKSGEVYKMQGDVPLEVHDQLQLRDTILSNSSICYGQRPDLQGIIDQFAKKMGGRNVGVLVCGPESMQQSVASACRHHSSLPGLRCSVAFNFHSISFNL